MPTLTVLAGPNGAGKTIFSDFLLQNNLIPIKPFNPDVIDLEFPSLISQYLTMESELACKNHVDFAYECNLRKGQLQHINQFAHNGYTINLVYFFLENIQLCHERVKYRVEVENGNFVNSESIQENFYSGLTNLDNTFDFWDNLLIINNSKKFSETSDFELEYCLLAEKGKILSVQQDFPPIGIGEFLPVITSKVSSFKNKV